MLYDKFRELCVKEWDNGFGDVTELHLDVASYDELIATTPNIHYAVPSRVTSLANDITGTYVKIVRHENHAIVVRPPQPPPTTHTVLV